MVWTEAIPAVAGSVEAHAAKGLGDGLAHCVIWEARELLWCLVVEHGLVEFRLGFGSAQLCAAASLAQGFDGFAREGFVAN